MVLDMLTLHFYPSRVPGHISIIISFSQPNGAITIVVGLTSISLHWSKAKLP